MVDPARIHLLNADPVAPGGQYVLYWMQASQRASFNPALDYAIIRANELAQPVVVGFGLMDDYPEANLRHYAFMLQGLKDVDQMLARRAIRFVIRRGAPAEVALELGRHASIIVCDVGYTRHQRRWRDQLADTAGRQVVQVESDVVVPVETASDKQEFAARTLRPRIHKHLARFLAPQPPQKPRHSADSLKLKGNLDPQDVEKSLAALKIDRSIPQSKQFVGGYAEARRKLKTFCRERLARYPVGRREPSVTGTSLMAPHLHFGQISPVEIALAVQQADVPGESRDPFLEELIVRRELAVNFIYYQAEYDRYDGLPAWARQTLQAHGKDRRPYLYTRDELETAATHDPYWNAAQKEMTLTGYMHNMMRMYWGKKILEWKKTPREAFDDALYLNNKYFLCGRDPASFANVAWLFGLHDRPWARRPIFGTIRYMNAAGLDRKFDMPAYVRKVSRIESGLGGG